MFSLVKARGNHASSTLHSLRQFRAKSIRLLPQLDEHKSKLSVDNTENTQSATTSEIAGHAKSYESMKTGSPSGKEVLLDEVGPPTSLRST
jgi:hypothetical protein